MRDIYFNAINRRKALVATAAGSVGYGVSKSVGAQTSSVPIINCYTDKESYHPGEPVNLHASADNFTKYPVKTTWYLFDGEDDAEKARGSIQIVAQYAKSDSQDNAWPVAAVIQLPSNLKSGIYFIRFEAGEWLRVPIIIREQSNKKEEVLVVVATATEQAYNNFGGRSLYGFNSVGGTASSTVTVARPYGSTFIPRFYHFGMWRLQNWLRNRYACGFAADTDLHADANLLTGRKCVIVIGQSEYWSQKMRTNLQRYIDGGGRFANLSGCTCFWRIEYSNNARAIYCDRSKGNTHEMGWSAKSTFGSGFENGGFNANGKPGLEAAVFSSNHWLYDGANVANGSTFGNSLGIAAYEVDGLVLDYRLGEPYVRVNSGTPVSFEILATADLANRGWDVPTNPHGKWNWTICVQENPNGGMVFNAATVQWGHAFSMAERVKSQKNPAIVLTENFINASLADRILREHRSSYPRVNGRTHTGFLYSYNNRTSMGLGWERTKAALLLPKKNVQDAVPLYRFYRLTQHPTSPGVYIPGERLSLHKNPPANEGWQYGGVIGYAFANSGVGRKAVYAFVTRLPEGDVERLSTRNQAIHNEISNGIKFYTL